MDTHFTLIQLLVVWQRLDVYQITNSVIMRIEPVKVVVIGAVLALSALQWVREIYVIAFEKLKSYKKAYDNVYVRKMWLLVAVIRFHSKSKI